MSPDAIEAWGTALQAVVVTIGAILAYKRLGLERTHTPHIDFQVQCTFLGPINGYYVADVVLVIENKGVVMQQLHDLTLTLRALKNSDAVGYYKEEEHKRVNFPDVIVDKVPVPNACETVRVEPGVRMEVPYITRVPESAALVIAQANFYYSGRENPRRSRHGAERAFRVKEHEKA